MRVVVTGGAGFIGSHLVEKLVSRNFEVIVFDNLSSGSLENLKNVKDKISVKIGDVKDFKKCVEILKDSEIIFHFAANPEVRLSTIEPKIYFEENILTTFNIAEAARILDVKKIVFASSSAVYGDAKTFPIPEEHELKPISIYGASKAASEILLHSYSKLYGIDVIILRYANIIGPRSKHGVIYDFIMKLSKNSNVLEILGDGKQKKSYLYIEDAIEASLIGVENSKSKFEIYNIGNEDWIEVNEIARIVYEILNLNPKIVYSYGTDDGRGWKGDVKFMLLSIEKIKSLGWKPKYNSLEAVKLSTIAIAKELGLIK